MARKVIAVLGAGPGLGMAMARRFGKEGFAVALVSRGAERHAGYRAELEATGVESRAYATDVTDPERVREVLARIMADLGEIDTVYFGPASADGAVGIVPLPEADASAVRAPFESGVVPVVAAALPAMLERGSGALFFGGGLSGMRPIPTLGTLAPASAALRMYVLTLSASLADRGVYAGVLTIGGLVEGGDIHRTLQEQGWPMTAVLDPADIADTAWSMYIGRDRPEAVFDALAPAA